MALYLLASTHLEHYLLHALIFSVLCQEALVDYFFGVGVLEILNSHLASSLKPIHYFYANEHQITENGELGFDISLFLLLNFSNKPW